MAKYGVQLFAAKQKQKIRHNLGISYMLYSFRERIRVMIIIMIRVRECIKEWQALLFLKQE